MLGFIKPVLIIKLLINVLNQIAVQMCVVCAKSQISCEVPEWHFEGDKLGRRPGSMHIEYEFEN
jgi:hypothetical protein